MRAWRLTYLAALLTFMATARTACGAVSVFPEGARGTALGGATVTATDVFAVYNNQAALGFVDKTIAAMDYQNRFLLEGLHRATATFVMPVPYAGTAGIGICSFGTLPYNELRAGLAIGKRLGNYFAVGTQVNYTRVAIDGYGSTSAVTAELGILVRPLENLRLGAHLYNVTYSKFISRQYNEPLPVIFNIGAGYQITGDIGIFVQGEFLSEQNARLKAGIEYFVLPAIALRIGTALKPVELFAGVGYTIRGLTIDFAIAHHTALGYSPQMSVSYCFTKL